MKQLHLLMSALLFIIPGIQAQFNFFENMFGNQRQQKPGNVPSDSEWFQTTYDGAECDKYLCPHTLSCVHYPHHCPCAFPSVEEKLELGEGSMVCVSKGGFKEGEGIRKVELARKGLL